MPFLRSILLNVGKLFWIYYFNLLVQSIVFLACKFELLLLLINLVTIVETKVEFMKSENSSWRSRTKICDQFPIGTIVIDYSIIELLENENDRHAFS